MSNRYHSPGKFAGLHLNQLVVALVVIALLVAMAYSNLKTAGTFNEEKQGVSR